jgi:hypothetical protein
LADDLEFIKVGRRPNHQAGVNKDATVRRCTTMAFFNCELLALGVKDLSKMKLEFPQTFSQLFDNIETESKETLMLKLECIKKTEMD